MNYDEFLKTLKQIIENNLIKADLQNKDDQAIITIDKEDLVDLINHLKNYEELKFTILTDLFGADFPEREKRFEVVYSLLSLKANKRVYIKLLVAEGEEIASISNIYSASVWYEREAFDMYGIIFKDNPDLRRILTDYGFQGYPLRKDFPVTGFVEVSYDTDLEKVVYKPVILQQEFRNFDFLSPWQGTEYVLPGDEKALKNTPQDKN